ncbi:MAG: hypothetical protein R2941_13665 [Desulfobacterales bacterium]
MPVHRVSGTGLFWYKSVAEKHPLSPETQRIPLDDRLREQYRDWLVVTGLACGAGKPVSPSDFRWNEAENRFDPGFSEPGSGSADGFPMDAVIPSRPLSPISGKALPGYRCACGQPCIDEITELAQGVPFSGNRNFFLFERIALNPETGFAVYTQPFFRNFT